jgi:hypothetical protein
MIIRLTSFPRVHMYSSRTYKRGEDDGQKVAHDLNTQFCCQAPFYHFFLISLNNSIAVVPLSKQ